MPVCGEVFGRVAGVRIRSGGAGDGVPAGHMGSASQGQQQQREDAGDKGDRERHGDLGAPERGGRQWKELGQGGAPVTEMRLSSRKRSRPWRAPLSMLVSSALAIAKDLRE